MAESKYIIRSDENGKVEISTDVIAVIAGIAALEVDGVASIVGGTTSENIGKQSQKNLAKGIRVEVLEDSAKIDIAVNLKFESEIPSVVPMIQEKIKSNVETMIGAQIKEVNIKIAGIEAEG